MEYNLIINQAALRRWVGKIKLTDAAIIGFIRGLSQDDPAVSRHMQGGYYRLQLSWMLREMPLLKIKEDWLSRRLKYLKNLGVLDVLLVVDRGHRYKLYGKLSKLYFQEEALARALIDESRSEKTPSSEKTPTGENSELGENSHGRKLPLIIREDQRGRSAPPLLGGTAADNPGQEVSAGAEFEEAIAKLPAEMRRIREASQRVQKQADLPGLGPPADSDTKPAPSEPKGPAP